MRDALVGCAVSKKVSEQIWLSYFWNAFYKRTETIVKRAIQFAQNYSFGTILATIILFYSFPLYIFNSFLHILSHFSVRHIFIDFNLF